MDPSERHEALTRMLVRLRDALHRRGRLSSRNEALDEVGKLLLAHELDLGQGGAGIGALARDGDPACALRAFVSDRAARAGLEPLELALGVDEQALARDILGAFIDLRAAAAGSHADLFNDLFASFLADSFVDEKELGQYLTPPEVVRAMVRLALAEMDDGEIEALCEPGCGDVVLDPSCGVASFLAEFLHALPEPRRGAASRALVGIDKSDRMVRLARAQAATAGAAAAVVHRASALASRGEEGRLARQLEGRAVLILSNPPFGASHEGQDLDGFRVAGPWATRRPARVDSEVLFMERYLRWLKPGGQLVAVVPDSILTHRGLYADLRAALAPEVEILAVVSLPANTFAAAGTVTKTSILQLRRRAGRRRGGPAFIGICHDVGYDVVTRGSHRSRRARDGGDLDALIASACGERPADGLTARHVRALADRERWDAEFHASLPPLLAARLADPPPDAVFVRDVAELVRDRIQPRDLGDDSFRYLEIADVDPATGFIADKQVRGRDAATRARLRVQTGDVLVSTVRPDRRAVGVVRAHQHGAVCTTGFAVLRPHGIHPLLLCEVLRSDAATAQLVRQGQGIAYPAIEDRVVVDVLLPVTRDVIEARRGDAENLIARAERLDRDFAALREELAAAMNAWSR